MDSPVLVGVQVGMPRTLRYEPARGAAREEWRSGIFKSAASGPVWLGRTNLDGDGQADTRNHGGPDRAALAYAAGHYPLWRAELAMPDLPYGAFGENLTIEGLDEDTACIGDTWQLGQVIVQVSQPRQPCWKLERRVGRPGLVETVNANGRSGWYLRVLREGLVEPGLPLALIERPCPLWTVTRAAAVMRERAADPDAAAALAACPYLAGGWRERLASTGG